MADVDDPFALLGLARRFELNPADLQSAYLRRSAALHPDRLLDPLEQAQAAVEAARINDARAVLADGEQRANALLRLLGGPAKELDKSLPDGFLVEMLEVRQEMEQRLQTGDLAERQALEEWAQGQRAQFRKVVGDLFAAVAHDGSAQNPDVLRQLRMQLNAWRYIERMIEQLDPDYRREL